MTTQSSVPTALDAGGRGAVSMPAIGRLAGSAPRRAARWLPRLLETASAYLPLLLMAVLALGTWWLVKNTPVLGVPREAAPLRHVPDYTMAQFVVQRFAADGTLRAEIEGDVMRHYPDTDTLEIDNPRLRAIAPDGRVTRASAQHALANGDGSEVQLSGAAHVVREAFGDLEAIDFRSEFLHAFLDVERVRTHLPVVVTQGATEVRAGGMAYDNLAGEVTLQGRVRAVLVPPPGKRHPASNTVRP
ncbi:MAG: LPS export ABC transporter periplasmic protein LptC [Burkholderiaceae bacterium]